MKRIRVKSGRGGLMRTTVPCAQHGDKNQLLHICACKQYWPHTSLAWNQLSLKCSQKLLQ